MAYSDNDSAILAALKAGDVLSPAIAHERWGTLALHSAIARLRKAGHKISTRMVNGHGEYRLITGESCVDLGSTPRQRVAAQQVAHQKAAEQGQQVSSSPQEVAVKYPAPAAPSPRLDPVLVNYGPRKGNPVECSFVVEGYRAGCAPWER